VGRDRLDGLTLTSEGQLPASLLRQFDAHAARKQLLEMPTPIEVAIETFFSNRAIDARSM